MPQLEISTYLSQTTCTIIIFSIFYYIFKSYSLPSILQLLYIRSLNIKNNNKTNINNNNNTYLN